MALIIRPALASDAQSIGNLARQFASYLRELGDLSDFKLTANAYLRDGFGTKPVFAGLVAEDLGKVIGYLLYHFGYDSDRAARNMHVVDLYIDRAARNQGVGKALMARAASIAREASAEEMIWSVYQSNTIAATFYENDQDRRDSRLTTYVLQLSARASECVSCQRDRVTRIIGQSCGKAVNSRVITGD